MPQCFCKLNFKRVWHSLSRKVCLWRQSKKKRLPTNWLLKLCWTKLPLQILALIPRNQQINPTSVLTKCNRLALFPSLNSGKEDCSWTESSKFSCVTKNSTYQFSSWKFPFDLRRHDKSKKGRKRREKEREKERNVHVDNYDIGVKCKNQVAVVQFFLWCTNKVSTLQAYLPVLATTLFLGLGLVTQSHEAHEPKSSGRSRKPCWRAQPPSRLLTAPVGAAANTRRCRPAGSDFYKLCQESWQRKLNRAGLLPWAEAAWPTSASVPAGTAEQQLGGASSLGRQAAWLPSCTTWFPSKDGF